MPVGDAATAWTQTRAWRFFFFLEALYYELDRTVDRSTLSRLLFRAFLAATSSTPSVSPFTVQCYFRTRSFELRTTFPMSTRLVVLPSVNKEATHVVWGKKTKCTRQLQLVIPAEPSNVKSVLSAIDRHVDQAESEFDDAGLAFSICAKQGTG